MHRILTQIPVAQTQNMARIAAAGTMNFQRALPILASNFSKLRGASFSFNTTMSV